MSRFVISLDFELFWGVADSRTIANYGANVAGERSAIPQMLDLFARYGIRATWATVGMLMCRDYEQWRAIAPSCLPTYTRTACSPYGMGATVREYPALFFAPDLVQAIRDTPGQEIASHTYSHFYCGEPGATPAQFLADMQCAGAIGAELGLVFKSLVMPRNQVRDPFLAVLPSTSIQVYRSNPQHALYRDGHHVAGGVVGRAARLADAWLPLSGKHVGRAHAGAGGLVALPASMFLRPYAPALARFESLRLHRIKAAMTAAAQQDGVFHLWWHPHNFGRNIAKNIAILESLLQHYRSLQDAYGMGSACMADWAPAVAP